MAHGLVSQADIWREYKVELRYLIQFYVACLALNIIALPVCYKIFGKFKDGGAIFGKSIGLYISGYIMWFLSSVHVLKFTNAFCITVMILAAIALYAPVVYRIKKKEDKGFIIYLSEHKKAMIISEIAFLVLFVVLNWIFAHRIPGTDTERMMDLGYMVTMSKTDYMPPLDMWAAGEHINYYYFGQYIMTYLSKVSLIPVEYGYTFGYYMIPSWALVAVFSLVFSITQSRIAGVISAAASMLSGNFHYVVFSGIAPFIWDILKLEGDRPGYWFADSTRYIGYVPEVSNDKTISEFPSYSFIVGDLHAHVVNVLAVVVILAILWSYLSNIKSRFNKEATIFGICCNAHFILIGFYLGISCMSNYWDFPIYYVVSGSIVLFGMMRTIGIKKKLWGYVAISGLFIMLINVATSFLFNLKFNKMVEGIGIVEKRSMFYQLMLLWGFPVIASICFYVLLIQRKKLTDRSLYVLLLTLCSIGLVIIPEFIFIKDIYIDGFPRANTMFKLGYQAFIMFGICLGIIINAYWNEAKEVEDFRGYVYRRTAIVIGLIVLLTTGYSVSAVKMWVTNLSKESYAGFDASKTIKELNMEEIPAINALKNIVESGDEKQPIVLEADGDSFTNCCRVSVLTGYPTILGWHTHEWLWHNSHSYMDQRRIEVEEIYTGENTEHTHFILDKYGVDYIFIGLKEYEKFEVVQNGILESMGDVVYCEPSESGKLIEIIKVHQH